MDRHGVGVQGKYKSDVFWLTFYKEHNVYSDENCLGVLGWEWVKPRTSIEDKAAARDVVGLDYDGSNADGEKWSFYGYILKEEPTEFVNTLDVVYTIKESRWLQGFWTESLEGWSLHQLRCEALAGTDLEGNKRSLVLDMSARDVKWAVRHTRLSSGQQSLQTQIWEFLSI